MGFLVGHRSLHSVTLTIPGFSTMLAVMVYFGQSSILSRAIMASGLAHVGKLRPLTR
jgi:hypothetical protein